MLRPRGCVIWMDFAYPRFVKWVFRPVGTSYGLYTWDDIRAAFDEEGFDTCALDRSTHGLLAGRLAVLRKAA